MFLEYLTYLFYNSKTRRINMNLAEIELIEWIPSARRWCRCGAK